MNQMPNEMNEETSYTYTREDDESETKQMGARKREKTTMMQQKKKKQIKVQTKNGFNEFRSE